MKQSRPPGLQPPPEQVSRSKEDELEEKRKVYDNIHGWIYFTRRIWDFIDTPHFQRLRKIKQLGSLEYVFPGATHTRFEHSLGTAHLAKTFLEKLIQNNPGAYRNLNEVQKKSAIRTITFAGLLHDLGHGPYSHMFDSYVVQQIQKPNETEPTIWKHELASVVLFEHLVKLQKLKKHLEEDEISRVKALIMGKPIGERPWEFQIINNKQNGIDVDKLDYFRRDAYYLGAKHIYIDHDLLMNEAKIIDQKDICYPTKYADIVNNIFHCRYKLYKNYYYNLVSIGVELMLCDILQKISGKFNFKEICQRIYEKPSDYIKLTDNIIEKVDDVYQEILNHKEYLREHPQQKPHPDLKYQNDFKAAVDILERIHIRNVYKFVKEFHYYIRQGTDIKVINKFKEEFKKKTIIKYVSTKAAVPQDYIRITISQSSFGMPENNPLKHVGFFRKQLDKNITVKPHQIQSLSMLYTNYFSERSIKIFLTENTTQNFKKVEKNFYDFCIEVKNKCQADFKNSELNVKFFEGRVGRTPLYIQGENETSISMVVSEVYNLREDEQKD